MIRALAFLVRAGLGALVRLDSLRARDLVTEAAGALALQSGGWHVPVAGTAPLRRRSASRPS